MIICSLTRLGFFLANEEFAEWASLSKNTTPPAWCRPARVPNSTRAGISWSSWGEPTHRERFMHAVINHLPLHKTTDWPALALLFQTFEEKTRTAHPAFRGVTVIRVDDDHAILVVIFDTRETLAGRWFAEDVRPLLAGAVCRSVGEALAGPELR